MAGGTGAEDLAPKIDRKDYAVIRNRKPVFVGFSDFTFLLNEFYYHTRVPAVYFPRLKMGKGNFKKVPSPDHGRGGPVPGIGLADPAPRPGNSPASPSAATCPRSSTS